MAWLQNSIQDRVFPEKMPSSHHTSPAPSDSKAVKAEQIQPSWEEVARRYGRETIDQKPLLDTSHGVSLANICGQADSPVEAEDKKFWDNGFSSPSSQAAEGHYAALLLPQILFCLH